VDIVDLLELADLCDAYFRGQADATPHEEVEAVGQAA
jgi:hypothetical protein